MDNGKEKRITRIVQKSCALERSIESLKSYLQGESVELTNAEMRLKNVKTLFNEYVTNHEELVALKSDHPRVAVYQKIESDYYAIATQVHKLRPPPPAPAPLANSTALNNTHFTFTDRVTLPTLPEIKIPKFDGKHENWSRWKSAFKSLVHDRAEISGYVKHTQLATACEEGVAASVLRAYKPSDEEYPLAWQALCKAYDQKRMIISDHIDALLNLPYTKEAKPDTLAQLLYKTRQHVMMLRSLEVQFGDEVAIRLLERALPPSVTSRWVDRLSGDKVAKLDDLYDFVQDTIFKLRQISNMPNNPRASKKRPGENESPLHSKNLKTGTRAFVTTSNTSNSACPKCGQPHRLYKCSAFKELNLADKYRIVNDNKLCRNCLCLHSSSCSSTKRCREKGCNKDHHTLLHPHKKSKTPDSSEKTQS